jgi:hypothetical protein
MMAVLTLWQQQGCKVFGGCAIVDCTIADIVRLIYVKKDGRVYKRIQQYIADLVELPMCMINDRGSSLNYTLLHAGTLQADGKYKLLIHPFISRQLVGRKAVIRDRSVLKTSNPTALKLLLMFDSRLAVGHKVVMPLVDLVRELELIDTKTSNLVSNIKRAILIFKDVTICGKIIDMQLNKNGKCQLVASLKPFGFVKNEIKDLAGCKL